MHYIAKSFILLLTCQLSLLCQIQFDSERIIVEDTDQILQISLADIDNDGDDDLILLSSSSGVERKLSYFVNNVNGGFGSFSLEFVLLDSSVEYFFSNDFDLSDMDNDGDLDLIVAHFNSILYYLNDGFGNFKMNEPKIILDNQFLDFKIYKVVVSDADQDGSADITYMRNTPIFQGVNSVDRLTIQHLANDGNNQFPNNVEVGNLGGYSASNVQHFHYEVVDMDGDGKSDVLANKHSLGYCGYYKQLDTGEFSDFNYVEQEAMDNPRDITAAYYNDDIYPDFLVAYVDRCLLYYADGSGGFLDPQLVLNIPDGNDFYSISLVSSIDIDGDSDVDILTQDIDRNLTFLRNLGGQQFAMPIRITESPINSKPFYANIDDDHIKDLVVSQGHKIAWYKNTPALPKADFIHDDCQGILRNNSNAFFPNSTLQWKVHLDEDEDNTMYISDLNPRLSDFIQELGNYTVGLEICNDFGCDEVVESIQVSHLPSLIIPTSFMKDSMYLFQDTSTGYDNTTWVFGDGNVSTDKIATHSYTNGGIYVVELFLTDSQILDCTFVFSKQVIVEPVEDEDQITSVNPGETSPILGLFPNPSRDICNISLDQSGSWNFDLCNSSGEIINSAVFNGNSFQIDTSHLDSGIYFVGVSNSKRRFVQKLVVFSQ